MVESQLAKSIALISLCSSYSETIQSIRIAQWNKLGK
jgi:hypothetical protein